MFRGIASRIRLSQAAVVVENLLQMHSTATGGIAAPAQVANRLVQIVADSRPALFEGREGKRPHKLATAAAALAFGVKNTAAFPEDRLAMGLALGTILLEVGGKPHEYAFSGNDRMLFQLAEQHYLEAMG